MATRRDKAPRAEVKYWLSDTSCGYDLVSRKHVSKIADRIKQSGNPLTFSTANGTTKADEDIFLHLDELDEDIEPFVLPSTPAVLSIGRRCLDHGYSFRWPAGKLPYFITPKGVKVKLIVEDYIPYLRTSHACKTACAVISLRTRRVTEEAPTVKVPTATGPVLAEEVSPGDDPAQLVPHGDDPAPPRRLTRQILSILTTTLPWSNQRASQRKTNSARRPRRLNTCVTTRTRTLTAKLVPRPR